MGKADKTIDALRQVLDVTPVSTPAKPEPKKKNWQGTGRKQRLAELEKRHAGRPQIWTDPNELLLKGEKFAKECNEKGEPITMTGMAISLGVDRGTFMNYQEKDGFFHVIKYLRSLCEAYAERRLFGTTPTGAIFALKQHGWKDTSENTNKTIDLNKVLDKIEENQQRD